MWTLRNDGEYNVLLYYLGCALFTIFEWDNSWCVKRYSHSSWVSMKCQSKVLLYEIVVVQESFVIS
jgi:hypothetical protein